MYKLIEFEVIDSTNKYLIDNVDKYDSFTFVSSSFQTNGKGRLKRKWNSNMNENLLFSFLIKETKIVQEYKYLSISIASIIAKYLESIGIQDVSIKWPNDVYVKDNKICGILLQGSIPKYIVVGVGLNVNQIHFNGKYHVHPISIKNVIGKTMQLDEIKNILFPKIVNSICDYSNLISYAMSHDYLNGKTIYINHEKFISKGIQSDCSLKIINKIKEKNVESGEIFLNK